jgi:tRNA pseudouridine55 synthase
MSDAAHASVPKLLLVDKPKGITSFDVIRRLRRELGIKKMGHAGTLDPLASGLMLIGIGEGTKDLDRYLKLPKSYEAEMLIGERRSTGDMEGEILEEKAVEHLDEHKVRNVLAGMLGPMELPVPAFSAIKRDGVRLYAKARKGEDMGELPVRTMEVTGIGFLGMEVANGRGIVKARFDVLSGVYIRSLAEEFGVRLGYPATIKELRRTKIGDFDVADARPV